jgi:NAD(P)-dependent dehydrogenase (short-subunit alcohol dehydrogenase family)
VTAGIGRTVAEVFAERKCMVVGCGRRQDRGAKVQEAVRSAGGVFRFVAADVTVREDCRRFVEAVVAEHGRIDVLINNAGGGGFSASSQDVSESDFEEHLRLNLHSALFCSQRAIDYMVPAGGGVILNIASVQGILAVARSAPYNVAKAGLIQLTRTIAVEYLEQRVRANVIVMGGAATAASARAVRDLTKAVEGPDAEPDFHQYLPPALSGTALRDIATALVVLADDDARAITGATIAIDQAQTAGSLYSEAVFLALTGGWTAP